MNNPTVEEIVETAKSGTSGQVKTLSDIRFEKLEKEVIDLRQAYAEVIKINEEYRAANQELFAFASSQSQPAAQSVMQSPEAVASSPTAAPAAPQVVAPAQPDPEAVKQHEEQMLQAVLADMGRGKTSTPPVNDGM